MAENSQGGQHLVTYTTVATGLSWTLLFWTNPPTMLWPLLDYSPCHTLIVHCKLISPWNLLECFLIFINWLVLFRSLSTLLSKNIGLHTDLNTCGALHYNDNNSDITLAGLHQHFCFCSDRKAPSYKVHVSAHHPPPFTTFCICHWYCMYTYTSTNTEWYIGISQVFIALAT